MNLPDQRHATCQRMRLRFGAAQSLPNTIGYGRVKVIWSEHTQFRFRRLDRKGSGRKDDGGDEKRELKSREGEHRGVSVDRPKR